MGEGPTPTTERSSGCGRTAFPRPVEPVRGVASARRRLVSRGANNDCTAARPGYVHNGIVDGLVREKPFILKR